MMEGMEEDDDDDEKNGKRAKPRKVCGTDTKKKIKIYHFDFLYKNSDRGRDENKYQNIFF